MVAFSTQQPEIWPEQFNCAGDGTTDDTVNFQRAVTFCKAAGLNLRLKAGRRYLVTSSIDATFTTGNPAFKIRGSGWFKSQILHTFPNGEAYPVIDMSGNTHGAVEDISILRAGTSKATNAVYSAKSANGTAGNGLAVRRCYLDAGNVAGDCAAVFYNTDLSRIEDCEVTGGGAGISMGTTKPANVVSKFVATPTTADWTQGYIQGCETSGTAGPALYCGGGGKINIRDSYFALIGSGSPYIIENNGNCLIASGLRTENQSAATGVTALHASSTMSNCDIEASLETDALGAMIGSANAAVIAACRLKVQGSTGKLLAIGDGGLVNCSFEGVCGAPGVGTITTAGKAASYGNTFKGNFNAAQVITLLGGTFGLEIGQASLTYRSLQNEMVVPVGGNPTARARALLANSVSSTAPYTGGSGAQQTGSNTVKLGTLALWSGQLPSPSMRIRWLSTINSIDATGSLVVNLVQGLNTATLLSWAPPPTGSFALTVQIDLVAVGADALRAYTAANMGTSSLNQRTNVQGFGLLPSLGDATLELIITSATNVASTELIFIEDI